MSLPSRLLPIRGAAALCLLLIALPARAVPPGWEVVESTPEKVYLVLPQQPVNGDAAEAEERLSAFYC